MMLSHPPKCLKGIPSSNKKHVGSLKYVGGGNRRGGVYKKAMTFYLADFGSENLKNIQRRFLDIFATVILSYDTKHKIQLFQWLLPC